MVTVALVCDSELIGLGTQEMLAHAEQLVLVETFTQVTALEGYLRHSPLDVVLLDDTLPYPEWLKAIPRLISAHPTLRIIVLAQRMDTAGIRGVIDQGAHGLIFKGEPLLREILIHGIRWVIQRDKVYLSSQVGLQFFEDRQAGPPVRLGRCEREVLHLLANGQTPQQIALQLGYGNAEPVYAACKRVRFKLEARTNAEAIHLALQRGLIWPSNA
ncbi:MAG: response regulator transcription factor [Anaerolineales bacterium]|nr:response regulator transcription factor [Anaerolineales bacterium]